MNKIIREVQEKEKDQYQKVVNHLTQSWEWGEFREKTGVGVLRLGEFQNGKLGAAWQVFFHKIPPASWTVGYLPRPVKMTAELLESLKKFGRQNNALFLKIEPSVPHLPQYPQPPQKPGRPVLPVHTFLLDLTLPEEELLKKMHEKTRYNIRLAQKHGIRVEEKEDQKSLEIFLNFLEETEKRQGFYTHPKDYFLKQWQILKPEKMMHLLMAYYQKTPLGGILLLRFKDKLYYTYGGSSEAHREKMPNHLLHWEAIKLGKKLGCKTYDFWGAYLQKPEPSDPWYGLYRFKAGFGGKLVSYPETFDLIINPLGYKLYRIADSCRWQILKVKRKFHV